MKRYHTLQRLIVAITKFTSIQFLLMLIVSGMAMATPTDIYGQNVMDKVISIKAEGETIKHVLSVLEKSVNIKFTYNPQAIAIDQKISFDYKDQKLSRILEGIFYPLHISYQLSGNYIILQKQPQNSVGTVINSPGISVTDRIVTGKVTDDTGASLPGVSVSVKGTTLGATTDSEGNYSLAVTGEKLILVFSYIGYKTEEVVLGEQTTVNVKLIVDSKTLDEVVVVAFGTQKEYTVAGAITTIEPGKLQSFGTTRSVSNNLAGQVAGIIAVQRSGEPGYDNSTFWIRGISTFQGARDPLVLVDGVERSLNNIDPAEIESFSVLKDASASAVYGVRGANGVILINTKRGKIGKPSISFRYEQGFTKPAKLPSFLNAADYMELLNTIARETNAPAIPYSQDRIDNTRNQTDPDLYPDVNWLDAITNDHASNSRYNLTASGGSEALRYSLVGSYYSEKGIVARDPAQMWDSSLKLHRYNVRSNVDLDITPSTLLRINIGGYLQDMNRPPQSIDDLFFLAFETPPFVHPTKYSSGEIPVVPERANPWALATQRGYQRVSDSKLESLFGVEQDFDKVIPGLKGRVKFAFDRFSATGVKRSKDPNYYSPSVGRNEDGSLNLVIYRNGQDFLGYEKTSEWGDKSVYMEGSLTYSRAFGKHFLDALLLGNRRNYDKGEALPYRNQGMAARLSYSYDRRYIAEVNFGYNGSENFAKGKRYGFFPSAAIGWILTEEDVMEPLKATFSKIKLRASLGKVGNDRLDGRRFAYITTIGETGGYTWGVNNDYGRGGRREGDYGVANLTWETVTKANLGLELGLLNNSVQFQADFFKEQRKDIFLRRENLPSSSGFVEKPWANYGKVDNQGVDISLNVNKQLSADLLLSVRGTFTYAKNKIIEKDEASAVIGTNRSLTGKPVGQIMGLVAEGLFTTEDFADVSTGQLISTLPRQTFGPVQPGDIKYKDVNKDGAVDALDVSAIGGTVDPQVIYGFGVNVQYKNFDAGTFFQGTGRTSRIIGDATSFMPGSGNGALGNIYSNANDRWTAENPSQNVFWPRLSNASSQISTLANNTQTSSWWLKDMSFLRVRRIEIGYSLPKNVMGRIGIKDSRIFVTGNNLFTFSSFKLWDPEIDTRPDNKPNNGYRYPIMKSVSIGMTFDF
ncbi:SusC/RagA family TonB-linked outer membrane protein [Xanthocytophaga agilis]|uniref:SusC/RagA family TonB-linked outer membrane protein n=1 Tax=Xanthocytophaga agilis TaxID=3048010 RepID=A0AAE3R8M3_9BACT|nr:SusC/RagA family TonB-linked outer membrane protein [Xanthocytophaga agilis]MDJ1505754.1 SusC/RagA family TonB-linked outer membrane protein [Xanthocytophaga agilis]